MQCIITAWQIFECHTVCQRITIAPILVLSFHRNDDAADAVKHPGDTAGLAEIASMLGKHMTYVGRRAISIICHNIQHNSDSARPISFIRKFVISGSLGSANSFLDCTLNILLGNIVRFRF